MAFMDFFNKKGKTHKKAKDEGENIWDKLRKERGSYDDTSPYIYPTQTYFSPNTSVIERTKPFSKEHEGEKLTPSSSSYEAKKTLPNNQPTGKENGDSRVNMPLQEKGVFPALPPAGSPYAFQYSRFARPLRQNKDIIIFVIENSANVIKYKDHVMRIVNKIVGDRKTALFLFIKIGNGSNEYPIMDYDDITEKKLLSDLLNNDDKTGDINLLKALFHIKYCFEELFFPSYTFKNIQYDISSCNIICIGSGSFDYTDFSKHLIMDCIAEFKTEPKLKGIKYFCIKDADAVKVASLGFPVIGHIVSDFYE